MTSPAACPATDRCYNTLAQGKTTVRQRWRACTPGRASGHRVQVRADFFGPALAHFGQWTCGAPDGFVDDEARRDCARSGGSGRDSDLVLVRGVMGLFDGEPSAADLAQRASGCPCWLDRAMTAPWGRWHWVCSTTAPACPGRGCWRTESPATAC